MLNHYSMRLAVAIAFATSQGHMAIAAPGKPIKAVTVSQLLASPKRYDAKSVAATGYLLYPSNRPTAVPVLCAKPRSATPSADNPATIALVFPDRKGKASQICSQNTARHLDNSPVVVKGVFNRQSRVGRYVAAIHVTKIEGKKTASPSTQAQYGKNGYEPSNHSSGDQSHTGGFWAENRR